MWVRLSGRDNCLLSVAYDIIYCLLTAVSLLSFILFNTHRVDDNLRDKLMRTGKLTNL